MAGHGRGGAKSAWPDSLPWLTAAATSELPSRQSSPGPTRTLSHCDQVTWGGKERRGQMYIPEFTGAVA